MLTGGPERRRRFVESRRPIREDGLSQRRALEQLDAETPLERRETVIADLGERDGAIALVFEGRELVFPAYAAAELEGCFEREGSFRASELPGVLDAEGRLVLVRRLAREGFLRITG